MHFLLHSPSPFILLTSGEYITNNGPYTPVAVTTANSDRAQPNTSNNQEPRCPGLTGVVRTGLPPGDGRDCRGNGFVPGKDLSLPPPAAR